MALKEGITEGLIKRLIDFFGISIVETVVMVGFISMETCTILPCQSGELPPVSNGNVVHEDVVDVEVRRVGSGKIRTANFAIGFILYSWTIARFLYGGSLVRIVKLSRLAGMTSESFPVSIRRFETDVGNRRWWRREIVDRKHERGKYSILVW
jgi:hypothetical protein